MLKNYFKIGFRVLHKNTAYSIIHLAGLSVGLWSCLVFALTGAGAIMITLVTICVQALRAALTDPVKSLRNE